jgi:hypothetical protein
MASTVLAFALFAFIFAYLAVNTPEKHGALQIFNYLVCYLTIIFTGYHANAVADPDLANNLFLGSWNQYAGYFLMFIFLYFGIYIFNVVIYGDEEEDQE